MANCEDDPDLRALREGYEYEPMEEIERKRAVYRSHIVKKTQDEIAAKADDLEYCKNAIDILSEIVRKRERRKHRRERLAHAILWIGAFMPFLLGILARPWVDDFFRSLSNGN